MDGVNPAIRWRVALRSTAETAYRLLATDAGRARFWAESAEERDGAVQFLFPGGERLEAPILERDPPRRFALRYFGGSRAVFTIEPGARGGCTVTLEEFGVTPENLIENRAGWVSVLLNLKAVADHGIDLRNHDPTRTWADGYVDN